MPKSTPAHQVSPVRFFQFALVGASGLLVNSVVLAFATERLGIFYLWSAALATIASTSWNFALSELWVFRGRQARAGWIKRLVQFFLMNSAALLLRSPILWGLTSVFGVHYQASNLVSIGVVTVIRYLFANQWIWRRIGRETFGYNIHNIVTIVSETALPELQPFRTTEPIEHPTLRIRIGLARTTQETSPGVRRLNFNEGLGPVGFRARIEVSDHVEVLASPLLDWSPHVLYTNLVEPILRWTLVEKGYALIHGACLAVENRAYLITARTDTGKTTTILQILCRKGTDRSVAFISDDMTLVSRDGRTLAFPKPLTISAHTVRAIQTTSLAWHERLFLPLQSRIHSRRGRHFAHWLAKSTLPVATINAYVQCLVPPPKYTVGQLVPGVELGPESQLTKVFVIERGENVHMRMAPADALETLMRNCDDAYGFPPYEAIEAFLKESSAKSDLGVLEREIIASALSNVPTFLIRQDHGDWWPQVVAGMGETPSEKVSSSPGKIPLLGEPTRRALFR
jgi:putative flippase GtrA